MHGMKEKKKFVNKKKKRKWTFSFIKTTYAFHFITRESPRALLSTQCKGEILTFNFNARVERCITDCTPAVCTFNECHNHRTSQNINYFIYLNFHFTFKVFSPSVAVFLFPFFFLKLMFFILASIFFSFILQAWLYFFYSFYVQWLSNSVID